MPSHDRPPKEGNPHPGHVPPMPKWSLSVTLQNGTIHTIEATGPDPLFVLHQWAGVTNASASRPAFAMLTSVVISKA